MQTFRRPANFARAACVGGTSLRPRGWQDNRVSRQNFRMVRCGSGQICSPASYKSACQTLRLGLERFGSTSYRCTRVSPNSLTLSKFKISPTTRIFRGYQIIKTRKTCFYGLNPQKETPKPLHFGALDEELPIKFVQSAPQMKSRLPLQHFFIIW